MDKEKRSHRSRSRSRSPGRYSSSSSSRSRRHRSRSPPGLSYSRRSRRSISPPSRSLLDRRREWQSSGRPKKPCLLFAKGRCYRGSECWFLHDEEDGDGHRRERRDRDRNYRDVERRRDRDDREDREHRRRERREDKPSTGSPADEAKKVVVNSPTRGPEQAVQEVKQPVVSPESQTAAAEEVINDAVVAVEDRQAEQAMELAGSEDECILQAPPHELPAHVAQGAGGELPEDVYEAQQEPPLAADAAGGGPALPEESQNANDPNAAERRADKEARALKVVRNAVTDYVKDYLKPSWRKGHLTKESFKTIAQKAVDKVMSTLQGHEIPRGQSKVEQFMESSQPKIAKLVQGYLDKYAIH